MAEKNNQGCSSMLQTDLLTKRRKDRIPPNQIIQTTQSNNAQPKQEGQQGKADQRGYSSTAGSALQRRAAKLQAEEGFGLQALRLRSVTTNYTCAQIFVPPALNQRIGALAHWPSRVCWFWNNRHAPQRNRASYQTSHNQTANVQLQQ